MAQELRNNQLTIRIPRRIRDAIDTQAKAERRTTADVVNNVLAERYPLPAKMPSRSRRR